MGRVGVTVQTGTPRRLKRLVMECKDCEALDSNPDHASQASSVCIVGPVTTPQIPVGIKQAYDTSPLLSGACFKGPSLPPHHKLDSRSDYHPYCSGE